LTFAPVTTPSTETECPNTATIPTVSSSSGAGLIPVAAGAGVGGAILILILVVVMVLITRSRRARKAEAYVLGGPFAQGNVQPVTFGNEMDPSLITVSDVAELGAFGTFYHGVALVRSWL
jgi:hypothetical protein